MKNKKIELLDGFNLEEFKFPYLIAEINTSHFGSIEVAKEMIIKLKDLGFNCVKFQSWSVNSLYSDQYYKENKYSKKMIEKFSLEREDLFELKKFCEINSISFNSTPYSNDEVDFLIECNVPFIKIASMDLNNLKFLEYIAKKELPIVLSTGMGDNDEIKAALNTILKYNKRVCVLHCISNYPTPINELNLLNIVKFREIYPDILFGYSDHSLSSLIPSISLSLGACLIEKHFTLDNSKIGMDNQMALEPNEMKEMIENLSLTSKSFGEFNRVVSENEMNQRLKMRRSIITKGILKKNDEITLNNIEFKRPGSGISPDKIDLIIGKKLKKDKEKGEIISFNDLK